MEKLERREDVEKYIRGVVYSLVASDSQVFEGLVEGETDYIVQTTSLGAQKINTIYRPRVTQRSILDTISNIQANIDEPIYPAIEGSDEWYEFHDSVMDTFSDCNVLELEWLDQSTSDVLSTDDLIQKFSR